MESILKYTLLALIFVLLDNGFAFNPNHEHRVKRQSSEEDTLDVIFVGQLKFNEHSVEGDVYIYNQSLIIIDQFYYDGQGPGVYINVATSGNNRFEYMDKRILIDYPIDNPRPIQRRFINERLYIDLPSELLATDVKWISIWCEIFGVSFGDVEFPRISLE